MLIRGWQDKPHRGWLPIGSEKYTVLPTNWDEPLEEGEIAEEYYEEDYLPYGKGEVYEAMDELVSDTKQTAFNKLNNSSRVGKMSTPISKRKLNEFTGAELEN